MSCNVVPVPAPLGFYLSETKRASAINLIANGTSLGHNPSLDELRSLVQARQTAEAVKAAYLTFLLDVWEKTWGRALDKPLSDIQAHNNLQESWSCGGIAGTAEITKKNYVLCVWLNGSTDTKNSADFSALQIQFWLKGYKEIKEYKEGAKNPWSQNLTLPEKWERKSREYDLCPITPPTLKVTGACVDVRPLYEAAVEAIEYLKASA